MKNAEYHEYKKKKGNPFLLFLSAIISMLLAMIRRISRIASCAATH